MFVFLFLICFVSFFLFCFVFVFRFCFCLSGLCFFLGRREKLGDDGTYLDLIAN